MVTGEGRSSSLPQWRRVLAGRGGIVALLVVAGVVLGGPLDYLSDLMFYPWALERPSLMSGWRGALTAGNGERLVVTVQLARAVGSRGQRSCAKCAQLDGVAATCNAVGQVRRYRVSGSPKGRRATSIVIGASPMEDPPPDGLELSVLEGRWVRPDALELTADFHWRRGRSAISSTDDPATQPVPVQMRREDGAVERPCGSV
jgi:hypothetical protein